MKSTRCPHCREKNLPPGYRLHPECVDGWLIALKEKSEAKKRREQQAKAKVERAVTKARKAALESIKEIKAAAQEPFNKYIRLRDAHLPCVSCGVENPPMKPGGQWDAGHFLTRGARPELAFDEDNCHKQCKSCNAGSGKFSHKERTVSARYEEELLRRIGPERLALLKGPHPVKKWERDELRAIAATYKAKVKELLKEKGE